MDHTKCPYCGASLKKFWHRLTPLNVHALVKFYGAVCKKGKNEIHLLKDLQGTEFELTRHEWNNFTKLRFHALAVKVKNKSGYWLITKRGADFLKGKQSVPKRVQTFRNKVTDHDLDLINVRQVIGSVPYTEEGFDFDIYEPEGAVEETRVEKRKKRVIFDLKNNIAKLVDEIEE